MFIRLVFAVFFGLYLVDSAQAAARAPLSQFKVHCERSEFEERGRVLLAELIDSRGYLWLAGWDAPVRFDGAAFLPLPLPNDANWGRVSSITEVAPGELWVSFQFGGLRAFVGGQWRALDFPHDPGRLTRFVQTRDPRHVWVARAGELYRVERGNSAQFERIALPFVLDLHALLLTSSAEQWLASARGLYRQNGTGWDYFGLDEGLPDVTVWQVFEDPNGTIWAATRGGVARFNRATGRFERYAPVPALARIVARGFFSDAHGDLWIATAGSGLFRVSPAGVEQLDSRNGLPDDIVWSLRADASGNLFALTDGAGICRLSEPNVERLGRAQGIENPLVRAVARFDGKMWAAGNGGLQPIANGLAAAPLNLGDQRASVLFSLFAEDTTLWIGSQAGLFSLGHAASGSELQGPIDLGFEPLSYARSGAGLYVGGYGLVKRLNVDGSIDALAPFPVNGAVGAVRYLHFDGNRLRAGFGNHGLFEFSESSNRWQLLAAAPGITAQLLYLAPDDALIFARGLHRLRAGTLSAVASELPDEQITSVIARGERLWVAYETGVYEAALERATGRVQVVRRYFASDGLHGRFESARAGMMAFDDRGRLWLSSNQGISIIDPTQPTAQVPELITWIDRVVLDDAVRMDLEGLAFTSATRRIAVDYSAIWHRAPQRVEFRHRLLPLETRFVESGDARSALYPALAPGRYRFEVQARVLESAWPAANSGTLAFEVQPQWFERWTVRALGALLVALAAFGLPWWRIRALRAQRVLLEKQVDERTQALALANTELERQALSDPLTGLANRRAISHTAARWLAEDEELLLALLDVDHFKRFNDRYGHPAGDACLCKVAAVIDNTARQHRGIAGRWGGEEFVLLLRASGGAAALDSLLMQLREQVIVLPEGNVHITASIGYARFPQHGRTLEALCHEADAALYRAKSDGRDRSVSA